LELNNKTALQQVVMQQLETIWEIKIYGLIIVKSNKDDDIAPINQQWIKDHYNIAYSTVSRTIKSLINKDLIKKVFKKDKLYFQLAGELKEKFELDKNAWKTVNTDYAKFFKDSDFIPLKKSKLTYAQYEAKKKKEDLKKAQELDQLKRSPEYAEKKNKQNKEREKERQKLLKEEELQLAEDNWYDQKIPTFIERSKAAKEIKQLIGKDD
tara:strand:- start:794 stop:1423 length:630 start_codon:yes stop_codon:yes gene_type:complete